jgi:hypothetical protein
MLSKISGLDLQIGWLDRAQVAVRDQIQKTVGQAFAESETYKVTVKLDGNVSRLWRLVWYDQIETGIASVRDKQGGIYELPYQFPIGTELEVLASN